MGGDVGLRSPPKVAGRAETMDEDMMRERDGADDCRKKKTVIQSKTLVTQSAKNPEGAREMTELRGLSLGSSPVTCSLSAIT